MLVFKAHSTRAASTADKGVSSQDILKMADWSRESTFARFYHKPTIDEGNVTRFESILTSGIIIIFIAIIIFFEIIHCHI